MHLNCCHRRLPVRLEFDVRDDAGQESHGLFRPARMDIVLDHACPRDQRRETLFHELVHAFDEVVGKVDRADDEGQKRRAATIEASFNRDLDALGGEVAIHALFGDTEVVGVDHPQPGEYTVVLDESAAEWPTAVCCPACHHRHTSGHVANGEVGWCPKLNGFQRWRVMTCAECERTFRWLQQCSSEGLPWPNVVSPPMLRREVDRFNRSN